MTTFGEYTRTIVRRGRVEAHESGSATIEAEHLLLAISSQGATVAQKVLASVGLNREAIRAALRREFEQSLRAAGVYIGDIDLPTVSGDSGRPANLGTSAKLAIKRALTFGSQAAPAASAPPARCAEREGRHCPEGARPGRRRSGRPDRAGSPRDDRRQGVRRR